ncbi:MAG: ATP-binding cassette domain-containing protein [Proteobacteria bacterium]|jgi:tungstate transport system ATP-binding protein|nr:ATP-binding cassette domain-containing protein [Pseudomonadota bacterium]
MFLKTEETTLLSNVNLNIPDNGITIIMGPNGAGKSLLLRCLHGLIKPSNGEVTYARKILDIKIRKRQSMVFQTPTLLRRSVLENLLFVLEKKGKTQVDNCLKILAKINLEDHKSQPARLLSGGEKQRLSLARALLTNPDVLFLDEPTANLDPSSVLLIENLILEARSNGIKIILITHDIAQAKRLADEVIFINKGHIIEHTKAKTFFIKPSSSEAEAYLGGNLLI